MTPVSPLSLTLLGCPAGALTAASTCTGGVIQNAPANTTSYVSTVPNTNTSDNGIAKIDYRINDKHMINGMLYKANYSSLGEDFPMVNTAWGNNVAGTRLDGVRQLDLDGQFPPGERIPGGLQPVCLRLPARRP